MNKTRPLGNKVAVWKFRAVAMAPAADQVPEVGLYNSAVASHEALLPPATSTLPLGNRVAVWFCRMAARLPVAVHTPVVGSYISATAETADV